MKKCLPTINEYIPFFCQSQPRFSIKITLWASRKGPLTKREVRDHLNGKCAIGTLGKWYPAVCILDIDDRDFEYVKEIRLVLNLDETNSMLCGSESPNSYHLIFRPLYNGKPPTLNLLKIITKNMADGYNIEVYPQANHTIRLPFGKNQPCLDAEYAHLESWQHKFYWFQKLDEYNLEFINRLPASRKYMDIRYYQDDTGYVSTSQQGKDLLEWGLQAPSSRHDSQWKVIYYLWRCNTPLETTIELTKDWIKIKHNGYSKTINSNPSVVYDEIVRQANHIYTKYDRAGIYPDDTHRQFYGYITEPDLREIFEITGGNMPRAKFLLNLIKYCYPRCMRDTINVHSKLLRKWTSSHTYLKYLRELEEKGILQRLPQYSVGNFSKPIKIEWEYKNIEKAIMVDGRSPDTFHETLMQVYTPDDLRAILRNVGKPKQSASEIIQKIYSND